jgi:hypothetical protein
MRVLPLPWTVGVVANCFVQAQKRVQGVVTQIRPDADEEAITNDLERELAEQLHFASAGRHIETAFMKDLIRAYPQVDMSRFAKAASGLIAMVSWHNRAVEKITGGDFGLVLVRPLVVHNYPLIKITSGYGRGVTVQAKKMGPGPKRGTLTQRQEEGFADFKKQGAVVVYRFEDEHTLHDFEWHDCRRRQLRTVRRWLRDNAFPKGLETAEFVNRLGNGSLGTADATTIERSVSPHGQRTLVIRIDWPDGRPPESSVSVLSRGGEQRKLIHVRH